MIQTAPLQAKTFLRAIVNCVHNTNIEQVKVEEVIEHCLAISHVEGHKRPNPNELLGTANWLETNGLILIDDLKHGIHAKGSSKFICETKIVFRKHHLRWGHCSITFRIWTISELK